jgi:hypothetical protein
MKKRLGTQNCLMFSASLSVVGSRTPTRLWSHQVPFSYSPLCGISCIQKRPIATSGVIFARWPRNGRRLRPHLPADSCLHVVLRNKESSMQRDCSRKAPPFPLSLSPSTLSFFYSNATGIDTSHWRVGCQIRAVVKRQRRILHISSVMYACM